MCFIIAKNYRVLKHAKAIVSDAEGFIIAKNYRVLKPQRGLVAIR